jgi:hypothetical protein
LWLILLGCNFSGSSNRAEGDSVIEVEADHVIERLRSSSAKHVCENSAEEDLSK